MFGFDSESCGLGLELNSTNSTGIGLDSLSLIGLGHGL